MTLAEYRSMADVVTHRLSAAQRVLQSDRRKLDAARTRGVLIGSVRELAQEVATNIQRQAYSSIASVVSHCLSAIFDEPYELEMDFGKKRGRTEVVISFRRDGKLVDPMSASGGGAVDVAAFALRLACLMMSRKARRLLVLDEPFKFVSAEYRDRVRAMLETVSEEMGVQIVMVTHVRELETGNVLQLRGKGTSDGME